MKIVIISDIHANIAALRAIQKTEKNWDEVYCAGDYVDYGTDPHEVIKWAKEYGVHGVKGNHDQHLLNILQSGETERFRGTQEYKWVHDNCDRMTDEDIAFLRALPQHLSFCADGIAYVMQHQMKEGSYDTVESVSLFDEKWKQWYEGPMDKTMQRRMIFGHTHRRVIHMLQEDRLWMNPGSVSYRRPDDTDKRAHYMVVEDGQIRFGAVEYDRSAMLARAMQYVRNGTMLKTDLQDAMFFFGDAAGSREPLPEVDE